jgi:NAD(P)-dependent dehydrogenase (short-subunit alcohol dehydrogenase family)
MRTAIITGGSRGLGLALTTDLASDGWNVVIDGRDADAVRLAAEHVGPTVTALPGDVTDADHRAALVAAAWELGGLDLLVSNASELGPSPLVPLRRLPVDTFEHVLRVNVVAPLALAQEALPLLAAHRGDIVHVTSDAAVEAYGGWGGYGSSKAALDHLSLILGVEEPDVRVWAFDPGDMRTRMHQDAFPGEDISDRPEPATVVPALRRLLDERPPSGRYRAADLAAETVR